MQTSDYTTRFSQVADPSEIDKMTVCIVGTGAVGRPLSIQLAQAGVSDLILFDDDIVSKENIGPQGWGVADIGEPKVEVLEEYLKDYFNADPVSYQERWEDGDARGVAEIVCCCADDMDVRAEMFEWALKSPSISMFIDSRMGAVSGIVYAVPLFDESPVHEKVVERYRETLFPQSEAEPLPCSLKATPYTASIISAIMARCILTTCHPEVVSAENVWEPLHLNIPFETRLDTLTHTMNARFIHVSTVPEPVASAD